MTSCPDVRVRVWSIEERHAALALAALLLPIKDPCLLKGSRKQQTKTESCRCCRESDKVNLDLAVNFLFKVQMKPSRAWIVIMTGELEHRIIHRQLETEKVEALGGRVYHVAFRP